ncbi:MAG: glycosyltransferase family 4 protein [Patescibacteria group bacterium]|nr:glycosyltransferase family 4 protein [Patescibacteria group bacterium]
MKLLLCTLEYPPQIGGVANYYSELIEAWPETDTWTVLDNSQRKLLSKSKFFPWLSSVLSLIKEYRRHNYDLIFIGQVLPLGTAALISQFFTGFKYGLFFHGMDFTFALKSSRKRWLLRLILKKAKIIVCANSYVEKLLIEFAPKVADKTKLINPGVKKGLVDEEVKQSLVNKYNLTGKKIIFSIGRLVKRKGFDQVIKALEGTSFDNWVYILAGDGPELESLRSLALASKVKDKIIFIGRLNEKEKWSCLSLCDIFITTSRDLDGDFEGFGIVYLEAALMSKPVIAGLSGGVSDAVINNECGLLVDSESIPAIEEALSKLLKDEDLARTLGEYACQRAKTNFNWKQQSENLSKFLKSFN